MWLISYFKSASVHVDSAVLAIFVSLLVLISNFSLLSKGEVEVGIFN